MFELHIKMNNGQPEGHPILKENLLQAYPTDPGNYTWNEDSLRWVLVTGNTQIS